MKLPCHIVKDLLPGYVDGCVSGETADCVKAHLEECQECRAMYEAMKAPMTEEPAIEAEEIDYFRRIKKSGRKKILTAVLLTCGLFLGAFLFFRYVGGQPVPAGVEEVSVEDGYVTARVSLLSGEDGYVGYELKTQQDGRQSVEIMGAKRSFLHSDREARLRISLEEIETYLYLADVVISRDGTIYDRSMVDLVDERIPYVGNASGVMTLLRLAGFGTFGKYQIELNTAKEPYQILVFFENSVSLEEYEKAGLIKKARMVLACVDNCHQMEIRLRDDTLEVTQTEKADSYEALRALAEQKEEP